MPNSVNNDYIFFCPDTSYGAKFISFSYSTYDSYWVAHEVTAGSGGGGGSGATYLSLYDIYGSPTSFSNAAQANSCKFMLSGTAQTFVNIQTLMNAGPVYIKDSTDSIALVQYADTSAGGIFFNCVTYSYGTVACNHQYQGEWSFSAI